MSARGIAEPPELAEIRRFQAAGYRVMFDPRLDTPARQMAMLRLLDRARRSSVPEFACRGLERSLIDSVFGRDREADHRERWLVEAVRRDCRRSA